MDKYGIDEYARKKHFVDEYLAPMLYACEEDISKVEYVENGGREYVRVYYAGSEHFFKSANVTMDSLMALVVDTVKQIFIMDSEWKHE